MVQLLAVVFVCMVGGALSGFSPKLTPKPVVQKPKDLRLMTPGFCCSSPEFVKQCGPVVDPEMNCGGRPDGDYAHPTRACDTFEYFSCSGGQVSPRYCSQTFLRFDEELQRCEPPIYIKKCGGSPTVPTDPPVFDTTVTPSYDCSNKEDGFYVPEGACSEVFYSCVGGAATELPCPGNLVYDVETERCLSKAFVRNCGGTPTTPQPIDPVPSTFAPPSPLPNEQVVPQKPKFNKFAPRPVVVVDKPVPNFPNKFKKPNPFAPSPVGQ